MPPEREEIDADIRLEPVTGKYASLVYLANGRSVLWSVKISSAHALNNVRLCVTYTPRYTETQRYWISHINAHEDFTLQVSCPEFDENALLGIRDDEDGTICIELQRGDGTIIAKSEGHFKWLAYNAWAGGREFPELLAALVLPHDPAVDSVLQRVKRRLGMSDEAAWPGYDDEPEGVKTKIQALWETLLQDNIDYKLPPTDGIMDIGVGQRVRTPSYIFQKGYSTCLDSSLLIAACLTRMRINPIVILIPQHAFLGVALRRMSMPMPLGTPLATIRNLSEQDELIALETTFINQAGSFEEACRSGISRLYALSSADDFEALDIEQIWHELGIHPIIGDCPEPNNSGSKHDDTPDTLVSEKPRTRLESWQRKLLDLSLRNNLLNVSDTNRNHIPLVVPDVAKLEDMLAEGSSFRIKTLPDTFWTDTALAQSGAGSEQATKRLQEGACVMFRKRELLAQLSAAQLQRVLSSLYTASRREMEESGVNTLFIACGFLSWQPKGHTERTLRAPLLLIPVRLTRASVRDGFTLSSMEDETQINQTLLELLKTEFSLSIPELEGELPKDDAGLDVPRIFELMRKAITCMPGWEVQNICSLGIFSFSKFLMWKDLTDRREALLRNPVVKQLAEDDRGMFPEQVGFPELKSLDSEVDAYKVYTPLASDSSQLAAVLAAARGKSFVLEGPPGTGKSQTIANMIAHCLGHGKTVLFVAEKAVALEVVYKRLARIGLGQFCLELHSTKTRLTSVIEQFRDAIGEMGEKNLHDDWEENVAAMTGLRYRLNVLPEEMHRPYPDGSSLYEDICLIAAHDALPTLTLPIGNPAEYTREQKKAALDCAHELVAHYALIENTPRQVVARIATTDYSPEWEEALDSTLNSAAHAAAQVQEDLNKVASLLGYSAEELQAHRAVFTTGIEVASKWPGADWSHLLPSHAGKTLRTLRAVAEDAEEYRQLRQTLSLPYPDTATDTPELDSWLRVGKQALTQFAPLRWWSMRKLRKNLQALAGSTLSPDCLHDLQTLIGMREVKQRLLSRELSAIPAFLNKQLGTLPSDLQVAEQLVSLLSQLTPAAEDFARSFIGQRERLSDDTRIAPCLDAYRAHSEAQQAACDRQAELLGTRECYAASASPADMQEWVRTLSEAKRSWRDIILWNKCASQARSSGYAALVESLLSGELSSQELENAVAVSIARAKLKAATAAEEPLRDFSPLLHEKRISDFAEQEAQLREMAGTHIRHILCKRAAGISRYEKEVAVLQRETAKKRAHMPLRKLLAATPNITSLLKPCFLMSPLSVAQYLSTDAQPFDVVIFDEASQIPVWDAVGAIARGKSVIICGDPHQMPPTSFFSRNRAEDDSEDGVEPDLESILDECLACGVPKMNLTWHYRSKSEALIAFSNEKYYEGKMTTFPAPLLRDTALQLHRVQGVYEPGASKRINQVEAEAVVNHVLGMLRTPGFRYTEATSIGVVTFNAQQQKLISDMFDAAREQDPALEPFFAEDNPEAVFVKNLENVQGDERGVICFSTTYGRDAEGHMAMNFGPLNLTGGERRLNVAVTRARYAMHVFTSMSPDDINLSRTRARGAADLRAFLEYARSASQVTSSGISAKRRDELCNRVAEQLSSGGWNCRTHVGASDYQVDIVVENPDSENSVLAGITLDGPSYSAAHTARDRDVVRPDTMRLLGWNLMNLWSLDWWRDPEACMDHLVDKLHHFRSAGERRRAELPSLLPSDAPPPSADAPPEEPQPKQPAGKQSMPLGPSFTDYVHKEPLPALFEIGNRTLLSLIQSIAAAEAPLSHLHLFARLQSIAPIPMARNTRAYKECIAAMADKLQQMLLRLQEEGKLRLHSEESLCGIDTQTIISLPGKPTVQARACGSRPLELVPLSELGEISRLVQVELKCIPGSDDHLRGMSDFLGLGRLTKKTKEQLLFAIQNHSASSQSAADAEQQE